MQNMKVEKSLFAMIIAIMKILLLFVLGSAFESFT